MGFSTLIDILGSTIIGGVLFLIILRFHEAGVANMFNNGDELITQLNLVEVVKLIEHDFNKIGYCQNWNLIPTPTKAILAADSTSISFLSDINDIGVVDTIHYYLGSPNELLMTENPRDRLLYRVINSDNPLSANLGVTEFYLVYFNALGDKIDSPVPVPGEINTIQINVTIENTAGYNNNYTSTFWRQIKLSAKNLRNR